MRACGGDSHFSQSLRIYLGTHSELVSVRYGNKSLLNENGREAEAVPHGGKPKAQLSV